MKINIIACGAGGLLLMSKIRSELEGIINDVELTVYGFDGSTSAVGEHCDKFFIPKKNDDSVISGSCGERASNYQVFKPFVESVFETDLKALATPQDGSLNIVISSLGGGSGAMLANVVLPVMMRNDVPTFYIGIKDGRTEQLAVNTWKQLVTLHNLPRIVKKPLSAMFVSNDNGEDAANKEVTRIISLIGFMGNEKNVNIDTNDITYIGALGSFKSVEFANDVYKFNIGTIAGIDDVRFHNAEIVRVLTDHPYEITNAIKIGKAGQACDEVLEVFRNNGINAIYMDGNPGIEGDIKTGKQAVEEKKKTPKNDDTVIGDTDDLGVLI